MKKLLLIPLLFLLLLPGKSLADGRVVGGENASIKKWPSTVSLVIREDYKGKPIRSAYWGHYCTGTLITRQYVLTARHCEIDDSLVDVVIGREDLTKINTGERIPAMFSVIYPKLDSNNDGMDDFGGDLLLLKLVRPSKKGVPLGINNIRQPLGAGTTTEVAGWGYTSTERPKRLQTASLPIQSDQYCAETNQPNSQWDAFHFVPGYQFCAGYPEGGADSCMGDSGGPLMQHGYLVGLVSFGPYYCGTDRTGVYVRVARFKKWIKGWIKRMNKLKEDQDKKPVREKIGWAPKKYIEWAVIEGSERFCRFEDPCSYFDYSLQINSNRKITGAKISYSSDSSSPLCPGDPDEYERDFSLPFIIVFDDRCSQSLEMTPTPGGEEVSWEGWSASLPEDPCPTVTISATIDGKPFEKSFGACQTPSMVGEIFKG